MRLQRQASSPPGAEIAEVCAESQIEDWISLIPLEPRGVERPVRPDLQTADVKIVANGTENNLGLSRDELRCFCQRAGEPGYRGRQLFAALHDRRLRSFDEITDLPKALRAKLAERATASGLSLESRYISADGTAAI